MAVQVEEMQQVAVRLRRDVYDRLDRYRNKINSGLTLNQSMWSKEYRKAGGLSYVLLRIGREFTCLIVDSEALYNRPSRKEFMELISWGHEGDLKKSDWDSLASRITCQDHPWQKLADRLDLVINN